MRLIRSRFLAAGVPAWLVATALASLLASTLAAAAPAEAEPVASWLVRLDGPTVLDLSRTDPAGGPQSPGAQPPSADPPSADPGNPDPAAAIALEAQRRAIEADQAVVARAAEDVGATVVDAYQVVYNGLLVHATRDAAAALAAVPGVAAVTRAPRLTLDVGDVVRTVKADVAKSELDLDGEGSVVAVVDTGIDYTHAAFGGPGTIAAYEENEENKVEKDSFPTGKVIGGYDFAGWRYSPACPDASQTTCHPRPKPDDDPLDPVDLGHGSHVAGIVAGERTSHLAAGVAPGARLVALKIFGNPIGAPATTDLAIGAIDWVVRHNMGLDVPGLAPTARIDIVNLSLGADWSGHMEEINRAVDAAVESGLTVVASGGNAGPLPYSVNSPSSADLALSVASSIPSGESELRVSAVWTEQSRPQMLELDAIEGSPEWLPRLADVGPVRSTLAWYGLACNTGENQPSKPAQELNHRIALVERGDCSFHEKVTNAERFGAVAVVVFSDGFQKSIMTCPAPCASRPGIPAVMIDREPGVELRDLAMAGAAVNMTLGSFEKTYLTDTISDFSSRGPARFDALIKPQITAPGTNVTSALVGSGNDGQTLSGTSMASPAMAGVAALLWQRNRDRKLSLNGADIGAWAMNYADPVIRIERQDTGPLAPVMRQGAGRANAWRSANGTTLVRSQHGLAALGFGHVHVTDEVAIATQRLRVRNLGSRAQTYAPSERLAFPDEDKGRGAELTFEPERLTVEAGKEGTIEVTMTVRPAGLRDWDLRGAEPMRNEAVLQTLEIDGWVDIAAVDAQGRPVGGGDRVGVPFHVLPRRHACVASATNDPLAFLEVGERIVQTWRNRCAKTGAVELFYLSGIDNDESTAVDAFPERIDIDAVGVRTARPAGSDGPDDDFLAFAIHTRAPQRIPAEIEFRVYVDLNRDETFDRVIFNRAGHDLDPQVPPGRWVVTHAPLIPGTLEPDMQQVSARHWPQVYDLDASMAILHLPAREIGVDLAGGKARFDFAVIAADAVEDFPLKPGYQGRDYAPDGMRRGEGYTFDQATLACVELTEPSGRRLGGLGEQVMVPVGEAGVSMLVKSTCALPLVGGQFPGLMYHYPDNLSDQQMALRRGKSGTIPETTVPTTDPATASPTATPAVTSTSTATTAPPTTGPTSTPLSTPISKSTPSRTPTAVPPATDIATPTATGTSTATETPTVEPVPPTVTVAPPTTAILPATDVPSPWATDQPPTATPTATQAPTDPPTQAPPSPSATRTPVPSASATATATRPPPPTATSTVPPSPTAAPNLTVREVEVSQAVQQAFSGIPLVAGRSTLVRVTIGTGWGPRPVPGVTGRLFGTRDGQPLPGSPLTPMHPGGRMTAPVAPNPLKLDDTLNFLLPETWTAEGEATLWVDLNPDRTVIEYDYGDNRSADLAARFRAVPPLHVVVVPVELQLGGTSAPIRPDLGRVEQLGIGALERLYPVSEVRLHLHAPLVFQSTLGSTTAQRTLLQSLAQLRLREHPEAAWVAGAPGADGTGGAGGIPIYYAALPAESGAASVLAYREGGIAAGRIDQPEAAARAIGLALGLERVACGSVGASGADSDYPYAGGIVGHVGVDVLRLVPIPPTHFDFMSDCQPAWVSDHHYTRLFERLTGAGTGGGTGGGVARIGADATSDARGDRVSRLDVDTASGIRGDASTAADTGQTPGWLVAGTIAADGRSGSLDALESLAGSQPVAAAGARTGSGGYRLELRDAAGRVLLSHAFEPIMMVTGRADLGSASFGFIVPQLAAAARAVLLDETRELGRLTITGAGTPAIKVEASLLPPSAREPNAVTILWRATGGTGAASASIRYSPDGQTWQTLVAATRAPQVKLDRRDLAGGRDARLEIVASAGTLSGSRQIVLGAVANQPPRIDIAGSTMILRAPGQAVIIAAEATDLEDGPLSDDRLSWSVGSTGGKATGRTLMLPAGLPDGVHAVVLTATDSAGARTTAKVTVAVGKLRRAYMPLVATKR